MIVKKVIFHCPNCDSTNVVKNGKNSAGSQQFLCKDCGKSAVMYPKYQRSEAEKEQILATYRERSTPSAVRGVARLYHISRNTLKSLLKKK
jgi:transposase-like protein